MKHNFFHYLSRSLFRTMGPVFLLFLLGACQGNNSEQDPLAGDLGTGDGLEDIWDGGEGTIGGEDILLTSREGFPSTPVAIQTEPVYFAFDSYTIASRELSKVREVAGHLNSNPAYGVILEGHTDERGSREYNLALGERRALAVRDLLLSLGVGSDRIQTLSLGEEQPAVSGFDETAWARNRRVEFKLMR